MTRSLLDRLEALEREREVEAERGITWGDVMGLALRHETAMAALPPAERERVEATKAAEDAALRGRALSGRMEPDEIDATFPPKPPGDGRPMTLQHLLASLHQGERLVALVNLSRRERGLSAGVDEQHPVWASELARLGLDASVLR